MTKNFLRDLMRAGLIGVVAALVIRGCAIATTSETNSDSIPTATTLDCLKSLPNVPVREDEDITSADIEIEGDKLEGLKALNKYGEARILYAGELGYAIGRDMKGDPSASVKLNRSVEKPEFPFKVGRAFAKAGKHENAIACFTESFSEKLTAPNDANAYLNRGEAYLAIGQKQKAREDYQVAVNLFQKYNLPQYEKMATDKLHSISP